MMKLKPSWIAMVNVFRLWRLMSDLDEKERVRKRGREILNNGLFRILFVLYFFTNSTFLNFSTYQHPTLDINKTQNIPNTSHNCSLSYMFPCCIPNRTLPLTKSEMSIQESPSFRVQDGMLLDEIDELALDGGDKVPSAATDEDETLVNLPAPEAEAGLPIKRESMEDTESPCELDMRGRCKFPGKISQCKHSKYKKTESADFVKDVMKPAKNDDASGGLIWKANIVPDDFDKHFKKKGTLKMCSINNYDAKNHCIKPRRGNLLVKESDFFGSLVQLTDGDDFDDFDIFEKKDRWAFSGLLCGFPSLKTLEVLKIECKRSLPLSKWATHWKSGKDDGKPTFPKDLVLAEVRVILRSPPYSMNGWAKDSRGYVFWFEGNETRKEPRVTYGTNIIRQFEKESITGKPSPKCVKVHMISHRYAVGDSHKIKDVKSLTTLLTEFLAS